MLDLSRINSGKLTIKRTKTDLSVLAKETVEQMSGQIKNAGCQVSVSLEPELVGYWDSYRIEQVIANLINNACRYAAQKPMTISTFRQGSNAVLVVEDQGKGIAKSDQTRIFQRFEKAENTNNGQGLGLGLFIIHQIVEAHGGSTQVESDLGQGARFRVELPLALPEKS
jgi:signal transduction histidine kinase